jgi:hypothetical protein
MQRRTLSLLAALMATLPIASQAGTMDYTYAELGYVDTENDEFDIDGDGFALRGSVAFHENFFAFASYQDLSFDNDVDGTGFEVGIGGRWPLNEKIDLVGRAGIVKAEIEVGRNDFDDDGFLVGARLRSALAPKFEVEGGFDYVDLDEAGDDTSVVLEGRYFFLDQLAGGVSVQFGDDVTTIGVNARWTF